MSLVQVRLQQLFLSGGSVAMAAVMAGGMGATTCKSLSQLFFSKINEFTKEERNSGLTNIIMGLSFYH